MPADGIYALVLDGNVTGVTTNYSFRLVDTSDEPVAVSGLDGVFSGDIAEGQQETFTFTAPAGRKLYFDSLDGDNDPVRVEIIDPTETRLFFQNAAFDRRPFILPRSGTYTVRVLGDGSSSVGDYNFRILDLEGDATELTLGETVTATVSAFETEVYSFTGTFGQQLYFDSLVLGFQNVDLRLINQYGTSLFTVNSREQKKRLRHF